MRSKHAAFLSLLGVAMVCAVIPFAFMVIAKLHTSPAIILLCVLNLTAWSILATGLVARKDLHEALERIAERSGLRKIGWKFLPLFYSVTRELDRKTQAMSIDLVENRISSREELSRALERIVGTAYKLLEAESAELALFDRDSGTYHSSFVLGRPFAVSAQSMLAGVLDGARRTEIQPEIMIQPISFAGTVLGTLRVGRKKGNVPSPADQELLKVLAMQGTLAIVNSQYNEELLKMKRSSDESVRAKTGFLANLSHEIRGPLGIMLNANELVLDGLCGEVSVDQQDTLKMVKQNGQHLLELINDVLDYAKSESGKITPERVQIVVNDLLIDVTNVVRSQAQQKNHKLICKPSDAALAISCDRRHIRQMMINLLTNAVKYTPTGGTIEVWAERVPGNKIKISVKDTGIGIEREQRYKVFAAFERVENAYSIKQTGTGLGMPLTKRLAEVNGAMIDFESETGKGSTFWLVFPAADFKPQILDAPAEIAPAPSGRGERIVLADSDDEVRGVVKRYLEHLGFVVSQCSDAPSALKELREGATHLFLVGNDLIDDDLERFLQEVRGIEGQASLPIILVSSRAFIFDVEKYLMAGIDRCLSKPLELKELAKTVREVINSREVPEQNTSRSRGKKPITVSGGNKDTDILH